MLIPSVNFRRSVAHDYIPFQTSSLRFLYMYNGFSHRTPPRFRDAGLPWSVPGDSGIDGANAEEGALRRYRKVGRNDRWTNTGTIAVPGGDGHDYSPTLCHVEPGNILVTDGPGGRTRTKAGSIHSLTDKGFCRARESRRTTIESLPLVEPSGMEPRLVGFPAAEHCDDVGSQPYKPETGDETYGRWGESGRRTRPNANTADSDPVASGCGGSNSLLKPARPVRGGRVKGMSRDHVGLLMLGRSSLQV